MDELFGECYIEGEDDRPELAFHRFPKVLGDYTQGRCPATLSSPQDLSTIMCQEIVPSTRLKKPPLKQWIKPAEMSQAEVSLIS